MKYLSLNKKILCLFLLIMVLSINKANALSIKTHGEVTPNSCSTEQNVKFTASLYNIPSWSTSNATTLSGACSGSGATNASCGFKSVINGKSYSDSSYGTASGRTYLASSIKTESASGGADAQVNNNVVDREGPTACGTPQISGTVKRGYARTGTTITATWAGSGMSDPGCSTGRTVSDYSSTRTTLTATSYDNLDNPGVACKYTLSGRDDKVDACTAKSENTKCTNGNVSLIAEGYDNESKDWYYMPVTATANSTYGVTCKDALGNSKTSYIKVTNIDKENPTCGSYSYSKPTDGRCTRSNVNFSFGCNDTAGGGTCAGCTSSSYSATTSGQNGSLTISDHVGNTNTCSMSNGQWDNTAPSVSIKFGSYEFMDENNYTSDSSVTVYLTAEDSGSCNGGRGAGVNRICYKLNGATTSSVICKDGSSHNFEIKNEGITTVSAWAFDYSLGTPGGTDDFSYNSNVTEDGNTNGGNKSSIVTRNVYIDRTKPKLTLSSSYDGKWTNNPIFTVVNTYDESASDGSHSGIKDIQYYFSVSSNPSDIWGAKDQNRPASGDTVPKKSYGISVPVGTISAASEFDSFNKTVITDRQIGTPQGDKALSDMIYIHVRSCDKALTANGVAKPNCTTEVHGPYYYDEKADDITITANAGNHDWTNKLTLTFTANESTTASPYSGDRKTSGIDRIELFYDVDVVHEQDNIGDAVYPVTLDNRRLNCSSTKNGADLNSKTCTYTIDFNDLRNYPDDGSSKVMEEGNRFIKVRVYDQAQNYTERSFGPYRFDITKNKLSNIKFSGQEGFFVKS